MRPYYHRTGTIRAEQGNRRPSVPDRVELGDLEVEILRLLGRTGELRPKEIHEKLRKTHPVAYTTITNTLYRLVEKRLVGVRRVGVRRAYYRLTEDPVARARAAETLVSRLVDAFGSDAISGLVADYAKHPGRRSARRRRRRE